MAGSSRNPLYWSRTISRMKEENKKKASEANSLQGGTDGSGNGGGTSENDINAGEDSKKKTLLGNIRKYKDQAILDDSANRNPQVAYSQGQIYLG